MGAVAYALCAVTSLICLGLLMRSYFANRVKLLLWSSLAFLFFAAQNTILFIDLVIFPGPAVDLSIWRTLAGFVGAVIMLFALIWENSR